MGFSSKIHCSVYTSLPSNKQDQIQQLTLSLLPLRLLFKLFRVAGGGLGGGPRGSLGGPDLSRCLLKLPFGGRGDRLLGRFLGTENDRDLTNKSKDAIQNKTVLNIVD